MMHPDERQVEAPRQRLPVHDADQQGADQARGRRHGDAVEAPDSDAGFIEGAIHHRRDRLHMRAAGELRHDTAEDRVHVLRQDHQALERGDAARRRHDGGGGLVTRGLDAQDAH